MVPDQGANFGPPVLRAEVRSAVATAKGLGCGVGWVEGCVEG